MSFGLLRPSLLVLALPLVACSSSDDETGGSAQSSTSLSFLTNIGNSAGGSGSVVPSSDFELDPSLNIVSLSSSQSSLVPGGGVNFTMTSSEPVSRFIVNVDSLGDSEPQPENLLLFTFSEPQTSVNFFCTLAASTPEGPLIIAGAGSRPGDTGFDLGGSTTYTVESGSTSAQNMTVELSWNDDEDLDLSLIEPDGSVVGLGAPSSANGGQFGGDAVPCSFGAASLETVTYASAPPTGEYIIQFTDQDSTCTAGATTSFTATVRINGSVAETFSGTTTSAQFETEIGRFTL